jgi:hypothetical protein
MTSQADQEMVGVPDPRRPVAEVFARLDTAFRELAAMYGELPPEGQRPGCFDMVFESKREAVAFCRLAVRIEELKMAVALPPEERR